MARPPLFLLCITSCQRDAYDYVISSIRQKKSHSAAAAASRWHDVIQSKKSGGRAIGQAAHVVRSRGTLL